MTHVRLTDDGTAVVETIQHDPAGLYHPSLIWHAANTLADWQALLTSMATAQRWAAETGGITLPNGVQIKTGTDDQARITSVIANAHLANVTQVDFKAGNGWVTLSVTDIEAIAAAIALHVQACFATERSHHEAIEALPDLESAQAYDVTEGWPT